MDSVGSPEEEVKFITAVPVPHIITSSSSYPTLFPQVSNTAAEEAKENVSGEGEVTEEERKVSVLENKGNTAASSGEVIVESVGSPGEKVKLNTPVPAPHLNSFKGPPSLEEAWNPDALNSVASDNYGSECNNEIVTEKK